MLFLTLILPLSAPSHSQHVNKRLLDTCPSESHVCQVCSIRWDPRKWRSLLLPKVLSAVTSSKQSCKFLMHDRDDSTISWRDYELSTVERFCYFKDKIPNYYHIVHIIVHSSVFRGATSKQPNAIYLCSRADSFC